MSADVVGRRPASPPTFPPTPRVWWVRRQRRRKVIYAYIETPEDFDDEAVSLLRLEDKADAEAMRPVEVAWQLARGVTYQGPTLEAVRRLEAKDPRVRQAMLAALERFGLAPDDFALQEQADASQQRDGYGRYRHQ